MNTKEKGKIKTKFLEDISKFLKRGTNRSFSRKEISHALSVRKSDYHLFKEALNELSKSKKIIRIKGGKYVVGASLRITQGIIQITRKGFAFVTDERTGEDIFVSQQNLNTALDGDMVEIQLFAVSRGKSKEGQVSRIISRANIEFVGTYHKSEYYGFVVPDNPKIYRDFLVTDSNAMNAKEGQKVVVELRKWEALQLNPEGRIIEIIGFPDEPGVDISSVVKGFGLPLKFSSKVENEASKIRMILSHEEIDKRLDLREKIVFTIDPEKAKDFDDAVSLDLLESGNYQLGVHIADVSHFVPKNSLVDKEAMERGTSIYLVDRVIPMLPEHLSNELCSLQPFQDRLTFSCMMEINPEGEVKRYEIKKSIINSKRRYNYAEVQAIIDNANSNDLNSEIINKMHHLSRILRRNRFQQGSIDFDTPEVKFKLNEHGFPTKIIPVQRLQSMEMIEEFMLLANKTVTKHIIKMHSKGRAYPFIYRVHEKPDSEKLQKFQTVLNALGYQIKMTKTVTPGAFQSVMDQIKGSKDEILVKEVALRTMMKASYSPKNIGHFGLAFGDYTHFTSPIRRYPDLIVHRLLKEYESPINHKRQKDLKKVLKKICDLASQRERTALDAERQSIKVKQVEWISQHLGDEFEGIISGVASFGIFVETIPYLIEGMVSVTDLMDDYYIYEEKTYSMIGRDSGQTFRLGDSVRVKVIKVDREQNRVDFILVKDENQLEENFADETRFQSGTE